MFSLRITSDLIKILKLSQRIKLIILDIYRWLANKCLCAILNGWNINLIHDKAFQTIYLRASYFRLLCTVVTVVYGAIKAIELYLPARTVGKLHNVRPANCVLPFKKRRIGKSLVAFDNCIFRVLAAENILFKGILS